MRFYSRIEEKYGQETLSVIREKIQKYLSEMKSELGKDLSQETCELYDLLKLLNIFESFHTDTAYAALIDFYSSGSDDVPSETVFENLDPYSLAAKLDRICIIKYRLDEKRIYTMLDTMKPANLLQTFLGWFYSSK